MCDRTEGLTLGDEAGRCPRCYRQSLFYEYEDGVSDYEEPYRLHFVRCGRSECTFEREERCKGRARVSWAIYNSTKLNKEQKELNLSWENEIQ